MRILLRLRAEVGDGLLDCLTVAPTLMGLINKLRASLLPVRFMHSSLQF
jgi:hypothetical protein